MAPPRVVDEVVHAYLTGIDEAVPGLVQGFYLIGSVALDDFLEQSSDVDFVAITAELPDQRSLTQLEHVHRRLRRRLRQPALDGTYVTWHELASSAGQVRPFGTSHEGRFHRAPAGTAESPVTWHALAQGGVTVRGPAPELLTLPLQRAQLARWLRNNVNSYWTRWLRRSASLATPRGWFAGSPWAAEWVVTGVSRIHCSIATGRIISKLEATRYAASTFNRRWHPVIREAERIRSTGGAGGNLAGYLWAAIFEFRSASRSLYRSRLTRRRDVLAFGWMVIADINRSSHDSKGST